MSPAVCRASRLPVLPRSWPCSKVTFASLICVVPGRRCSRNQNRICRRNCFSCWKNCSVSVEKNDPKISKIFYGCSRWFVARVCLIFPEWFPILLGWSSWLEFCFLGSFLYEAFGGICCRLCCETALYLSILSGILLEWDVDFHSSGRSM